MSTWSGWRKQLLDAAGLPTSSDNLSFMGDWNSHANTNCTNNPVDISLAVSGDSPCKLTSNPQHRARNFASHNQAAGQFAAQIHQGQYSGLFAALASGNPYTVANATKIGDELLIWGSGRFANHYSQEINAQISGGAIPAPRLHDGWHSLQRSFNHRLPPALRQSSRNTDAALRVLGRARKVRS